MRISTLKGDSGYKINAYDYKVSLNGEMLDNCLTADTNLGICVCCESKGHWQKHQTLRGEVAIYPPTKLLGIAQE